MYQSEVERWDRRTARICMVIANAHKGKKGRPKKEKDFMPRYGERKQQSWQEQLKVVKQIHKAFGGN